MNRLKILKSLSGSVKSLKMGLDPKIPSKRSGKTSRTRDRARVQQIPDLETYDHDIKFLLKEKRDFLFPNWSKGHAGVVIANMLEASDLGAEMLMFESQITGDISDDRLRSALRRFVESGGVFRLVVARFDQESDVHTAIYKLLSALSLSHSGQVEVLLDADGRFLDATRTAFGKATYFAVRGNFIRVEGLEEQKDYRALCNVNAVELADKLRALFHANINDIDRVISTAS